MFRKRFFARAAALLICCMALPACYAETEPVTLTSADYGYVPAYYDGYLVYYDSVGRPFYYDGGVAVWISPASPYYAGLSHHWRVYGPSYHRWYSNRGYRYRGYRGAPGYHSFHGYRGGDGGHRGGGGGHHR